MRDKPIHDYFGVDIGQVWFTATEHLPRFSPEQVSLHGIGERPSIFGILRRTYSIASILASVIRAFALMKKWLIRPQDDWVCLKACILGSRGKQTTGCGHNQMISKDWGWLLMDKKVTLTAVVHLEDNLYVANCPEVGTVSQGLTVEEAVENLQEATDLYLEEFPFEGFSRPLLTTFEVPTHAWMATCFGGKGYQSSGETRFYQNPAKGSHVVLKKETENEVIGCVVPLHNELATGPWRSILRMAQITPDEFTNQL
jgi:predicted RNase H-like HicB family nuclease/predicted RNA binding protein YcfA (HicA-like mRNA interferase family)